jgi:hypothetical protein
MKSWTKLIFIKASSITVESNTHLYDEL